MILALDTYYFDDQANTAYVLFTDWTSEAAVESGSFLMSGIADYESGQFFKRELPCILDALSRINRPDISCILIDGYVTLDSAGQAGLGGYLFETLKGEIPVIGVAKNAFKAERPNVKAVKRGTSQKPLFITSQGVALETAAAGISSMHGPYRMPDLLRQVDRLSRDIYRKG